MNNQTQRRLARRMLFLLFIVSFFNYMDRYILSVLMPSIKLDLDLSDTQLGSMGTAFTISYIAFGIPLARLADKYTRKKVILFSLIVWSSMTAACGLAQNFIQLAAARVMVGVGESGATPPAHSIISDYFPVESRSKAIAMFSLGAPVGIMVGFIFASWLAEAYSWRVAFLSLGLPGVVLAFFVWLKLIEPRRGMSDVGEIQQEVNETPELKTVLRELWASPAYRHICIATGLYTVVWLGVVSWLPSYFIRSFSMSLTEVGFWLAMSLGISQLIGLTMGGVLTDLMIKKDLRWYCWIAALGMFISTPLFVIVFLTNNAIVATIALFPAFMIGVLQGPSSFAAVQGIARIRMRAMAVAIYLLVTNLIGGTIGPLLAGWLSDQMQVSYGDDSLRYSLLILSLVFGVWAGLHYYLGSRTIRDEVRANKS